MTEPFVVQRETHIAAPPASVFASLTNPDKILSWMDAEAATETHPGGLYLVKGIFRRRRRRRRGRPTPMSMLSPSAVSVIASPCPRWTRSSSG